MRNTYLFLLLLTLLAIGTVAGIFLKNGLPISRQALAYDKARLQDFQAIDNAMEQYFIDHQNNFPKALDELSIKIYTPNAEITDPETKKEYGYKIIGERKYQLCATFAADFKEHEKYDSSITYLYQQSVREKDEKEYKKGYNCLTYTISSWTNNPYISPAPQWTAPVSTPTPTKTPAKITSPSAGDILCIEDNRRIMWFASGKGNHKVTISLLSPSNVSYSIAEVNIPHENESENMDDYVWELPKTMDKLKLNPDKGFRVTIAGTSNGKAYAYTSEPFEIKDCYTY